MTALTFPCLGLADDEKVVDFAQLIAQPQKIDGYKVIQTLPKEVLVMKGGTFVLKGDSVYIGATKLRVEGNVEIKAYDKPIDGSGGTGPPTGPSSNGPDGDTDEARTRGCRPNGCPGDPGVEGQQGLIGPEGSPAGVIVLDVEELVIEGALKIFNEGQIGGEGGQGGKGGTGGRGGRGHDRVCKNISGSGAVSPGDGGKPGRAGEGGVGGPGGTGGAGGKLFVTSKINEMIKSGKITYSGKGGDGGIGGKTGVWGEKGTGNDGGRSKWPCGGGGNPSPPAEETPKYDENKKRGPKGKQGSDGAIILIE